MMNESRLKPNYTEVFEEEVIKLTDQLSLFFTV